MQPEAHTSTGGDLEWPLLPSSESFLHSTTQWYVAEKKHNLPTLFGFSPGILCSENEWIAFHTKPVIVSDYCSLITKLPSENPPTVKDWVGTISCNCELQCQNDLFRLFKLCYQDLRGPCPVPLPFVVSIPGLKSSNFEFASCVRSLQYQSRNARAFS